jgi:porcupine-like protein
MILIMKLISFAFDVDDNQIKKYDIFMYLSYLVSLNTSIFGPWISFNDFLNHFDQKSIVCIIFKVFQVVTV